MYTLLPKENKKHLRWEYRVRFTTLSLLFLSGSVWVGIVAIFPSYIISVTQEGYALHQVQEIQKSDISKTYTNTRQQIQNANLFADSVLKVQDTFTLSSVIEEIVLRKLPGISITTFEIGRRGGASSDGQAIAIAGKADTRDALLAFKKSLEADPKFSTIQSPDSNLLLIKNVPFTMNITSL